MTTLVLGSTGLIGGHVAAGLRARGLPVRAATRRPTRPEEVLLDLERPETFPAALDGVTRLFLVARPGDDHPERLAIPLIEAAVAAGVRRVAHLSALGAESDPAFGLRKVELALDASGLEVTHLRPNFFMQVFTAGPLHAALQATGALRLPAGHARISYVDGRDVAEAAVAALCEPGHAGRGYALTGPASLDHHRIAALIGAACGRPVRYVALDEDAARAQLLAGGLDAPRVERLLGFYRRVRAGDVAPVSPALPALLGRPATAFDDFARTHRDAWA